MNIALGVLLSLCSLTLVANTLNSISGRYGSMNKWWNVALAGSIATVGVIGAVYAFRSNVHVALGMSLLMVGVWAGMGFIGAITGRYGRGLSKGVMAGSVIVSAGAFIGACLLVN